MSHDLIKMCGPDSGFLELVIRSAGVNRFILGGVDAHALSHVVKDRLMAKYPQIADAVIHLEPPPAPEPAQ